MSIGFCRKTVGNAIAGAALTALFGTCITGAAAQSVASVKALTYQLHGATITIPELTVTGTALTDADLAALVAQDNSLTLQDRLKKLDHGTIVIPEADIEPAANAAGSGSAPNHTEFVIKDIKFADINQGVIAAASLSGATLTGEDATHQPLTGTFGAIMAKNVNVAAYLRILTEARKDPGEPLATLSGGFSSAGFKIELKDKGSFTLGSVEIGAIRATPLLMPYPELMQTLAQQAKISDPSPDQLVATFQNIADLADSIELDRIDTRDFSFDGVDTGKAVSFKFRHFGFGGFANGRIGEYMYEGLELNQAGTGYFKMGAFGVRGIDAKSALDAIKKFAAAGPDDQKIFNVRAFVPTIDQFVLSDFDIDMVATDHKGNLDHGDRIKMSLGRFEVDGAHFILGAPTQLTLILDRLVFPLPTDGSQPDMQPLLDLGYERFEWSTKFDAAWDEAAQMLKVNEFSSSSPDMGSYKLTLQIADVTRDLFQGNTTDMSLAALGASIKAADLTILNDGLFERLLAKTADDAHLSEADVRKVWISAVDRTLPTLIGSNKNTGEIVKAAEDFIVHPKSLHLTATSDAGIGVADFYNAKQASDILDKLELHATVGE